MGKNYTQIIEVTDGGPFVTKLVLFVGKDVKQEKLKPACFNVYVERKDAQGEVLMLPKVYGDPQSIVPSKGYCTVKAAYPSDNKGERHAGGEWITLELEMRPHGLNSAMAFTGRFHEIVICDFRITQIQAIETDSELLTGLVFDRCVGCYAKQTERFSHGVSTDLEEPLHYGYYIPKIVNNKRPLIVWLHGAGEGGKDPRVAYMGNKVVNLASDPIQAIFGGAFVLVPQTPTFWMNDGSGQYGRSGKSMYVHALKAVIDEFVSTFEAAIDRNRIYIGGCSNGGFMTMRMLLDYPDYFAAAFPVCQALYDEVVSDQDIETLKQVPIWFTHTRNDAVIKAEETTVPTYKRLLQAGADQVHFSYFDKVVDLHELFSKENGQPHQYHSHLAWVYVFNDDCRLDFNGEPVYANGKEVSLMEWLALQKR